MVKNNPILVSVFAMALLMCACKPSDQSRQEPQKPQEAKHLPANPSLPPSTFTCEAILLSVSDSNMATLVIRKVVRRGAALIYEVSAGDTLEVSMPGENKKLLKGNLSVQATIEERPQMNSEKPEFIVKALLTK